SQGGKTRRIHTLFMFPSLEGADKFNQELTKRRANLRSDGRPIVGINSRDLAKIALECDERALIIPAHAWTPWFSIFGSFSGFDSVEECFGDMSKYIYGIETGLSSDPVMNWQISDLNNRAILSFSDAHSLEKMGREATVFEAEEISYDSIYDAVRRPSVILGSDLPAMLRDAMQAGAIPESKNADSGYTEPCDPSTDGSKARMTNSKIAFTIEFYPEEGKYHFTGHRNCNFSQTPEETAKNGNNCPVCSRPLTVGVMHRVEELKSEEANVISEEIDGVKWQKSPSGRPAYVNLVPLGEILAEVLGVGVGTQRVKEAYMILVKNLGSEFGVLMRASVGDIAKYAGGRAAEAIARVRHGDIVIEPGYDGQFGKVLIWPDKKDDKVEEGETPESQLNLFV
ncbi:MAG: endonuclease Q family protein, partial [Candidatus Curtissbacteria bacterium]